MRIIPVILAGGFGTRLWPASRKAYPKQFADLGLGEHSLFQEALIRLDALTGVVEKPVIVGSEAHRFLILEQAARIERQLSTIILEPSGRNTCAAVAVAVSHLKTLGYHDDDFVVVFPSDHLVEEVAAFGQCVASAYAIKDGLATLGIKPKGSHSGYGYILPEASDQPVGRIKTFVEKPDEQRARALIEEGALWNAGMFLGSLKSFETELSAHAETIWQSAQAAEKEAEQDGGFLRLNKEAWQRLECEAFDRAVLEKTETAYVVPLAAGWSDLGSWEAVWERLASGKTQNVVEGEAVLGETVTGSAILVDGMTAIIDGVQDLVIVARDDALLVAKRSSSQDIGKFVEKMIGQGIAAAETFPEDFRPWGSFRTVAEGARYKVKKLTVKPGEAISLQLHHNRAEHWVVVKGTAEVQIDETVHLVSENESVYVPIGAKHRLSNPGKVPVEIIEVQTGAYLGEDDIVRLEDLYGRLEN